MANDLCMCVCMMLYKVELVQKYMGKREIAQWCAFFKKHKKNKIIFWDEVYVRIGG